ncbi:uncharacterized protein AMSG_05278 [Thecamonas trahens ATCC 50062]|uniref:C3H1-type domain-containing protein n=1 Tax=Thecamonas trahens ATCC 50062 TaxID=461836 RepID=A0A0L0DD80_THETB|nr:hypothetical protein AMSG_05278 [Thecamonas trahens ATCC 50062]KNC49283.1 hypothetical protein AMSG_05278 [Thecamonas trahens ATCC 50062]|eukprot:XP_013757997.1 hypothetical protein AMSG_05278 [Thecamonas trahens ATCC 50062]
MSGRKSRIGCSRRQRGAGGGRDLAGPDRDQRRKPGRLPGRTPPSVRPDGSRHVLVLYKTTICKHWKQRGTCKFGSKCLFAHGETDLRSRNDNLGHTKTIKQVFRPSPSPLALPRPARPARPRQARRGPARPATDRRSSTKSSSGKASAARHAYPSAGLHRLSLADRRPIADESDTSSEASEASSASAASVTSVAPTEQATAMANAAATAPAAKPAAKSATAPAMAPAACCSKRPQATAPRASASASVEICLSFAAIGICPHGDLQSGGCPMRHMTRRTPGSAWSGASWWRPRLAVFEALTKAQHL